MFEVMIAITVTFLFYMGCEKTPHIKNLRAVSLKRTNCSCFGAPSMGAQ